MQRVPVAQRIPHLVGVCIDQDLAANRGHGVSPSVREHPGLRPCSRLWRCCASGKWSLLPGSAPYPRPPAASVVPPTAEPAVASDEAEFLNRSDATVALSTEVLGELVERRVVARL